MISKHFIPGKLSDLRYIVAQNFNIRRYIFSIYFLISYEIFAFYCHVLDLMTSQPYRLAASRTSYPGDKERRDKGLAARFVKKMATGVMVSCWRKCQYLLTHPLKNYMRLFTWSLLSLFSWITRERTCTWSLYILFLLFHTSCSSTERFCKLYLFNLYQHKTLPVYVTYSCLFIILVAQLHVVSYCLTPGNMYSMF